MPEYAEVPENLVEPNRGLSGMIEILLTRFGNKTDQSLTLVEAGVAQETLYSDEKTSPFRKDEPGAVAADLARRAMDVLINEGKVSETKDGFKLQSQSPEPDLDQPDATA